MGLNRYPGGPNPPTAADSRHIHRLTAWGVAKLSLGYWQEAPSPAMANMVGIAAAGVGFYSIWLTVFAGIDDVIERIIAGFGGTYTTTDEVGVRVVRSDGANWTGQI